MALVAYSADGLRELISAFSSFYNRERLTISAAKTKVVVQVLDWEGNTFLAGNFSFEVVPTFKHLGVDLDASASTACMVQATMTRAAAAFTRLCGYLGVLGWSTPHTRLVLYNVYVRLTMLFVAAVWALLSVGTTYPGESLGLKALYVLYCTGL